MQNIIIDEDFRTYLPILNEETYESLEQSILEHGARDPLVLWNDILIDGYNRYKICTEHNIPFTTVSMEFETREDVLDWIIENQLARRNLTPMEQSHYRGMIFNLAKRGRGSSNQYTEKSANPQSEGKQKRINTSDEIGRRFKVSGATIERDGKLAEALIAIGGISQEAKRKVLSGEIPVDRNKLQRLTKAPKEEIEKVANQIIEGTYNRKDHRISKAQDTAQDQGDNKGETGGVSNTTTLDTQSEENYVDTMVSLITGNLNTTLKSLTNESGIPELKTSLRTLITNLEELYSNIK